DEPVTLTCRIERSPENIVVVPLTYHVNGHYIEFGREEFCLITGLTFGPEFSESYEVGPIPFRRLVFDSDTYGWHVTGQMLIDNINGEEFDNLHDELENANKVRVENLYAAQNRPIPRVAKYTLSGFTWAFKTWILEVYNVAALRYSTHQQRYPRAVAWSKVTTFQQKFLLIALFIFKGARPNRRLRPDAFEAKAEWWVRSREFFDGRIHKAPPIPTPVKLPSRSDVPKYVDPRQSKPKPVEVHEHYGLSYFDFSVLQNTKAYPSVIRGTPRIATPMSQQRFPMSSSTNQAGPSQNHDAGVVNPDEMPRGKRETFPSKYQLSPFTCMPTTTVAPKKRANNIRNKTRNDKVSAFNLGKADRPPGARYTVAKTGTSAIIDKSNKIVIETDFHLMGMLDGSSRPYPSWDDVDIVYMPINSGGDHWVTGVLNLRGSTIHVIDSLNSPHRRNPLIDHQSKWTNMLNVLLEKSGHFERTGRRLYNFELVYTNGLDFVGPRQGNSSDCGVVTCWVTENLCRGQAPVLYHVDLNFFLATLEFKCVIGCTTVVVRILKNVYMISLSK
nr:phospholipase-like protein [Tanacetum cinerariifolium]